MCAGRSSAHDISHDDVGPMSGMVPCVMSKMNAMTSFLVIQAPTQWNGVDLTCRIKCACRAILCTRRFSCSSQSHVCHGAMRNVQNGRNRITSCQASCTSSTLGSYGYRLCSQRQHRMVLGQRMLRHMQQNLAWKRSR